MGTAQHVALLNRPLHKLPTPEPGIPPDLHSGKAEHSNDFSTAASHCSPVFP
jgi:hypothetical protein